MNAESNQPQDIEVEYRFAGYYENETPPTLDELQDPKYLNNVIVHFEASATGGTPTDPNPVDPGDDDNNTADPNPVDPGDDDNNPTDPNDDNDPTDTDDPTNGKPESDDPNNNDNESDNPDNTNEDNNNPDDEGNLDNNNPDYPNDNNHNNGQPQDQTTGANTGDFTNALLWMMVGSIGCFCVIYPIRKRISEK